MILGFTYTNQKHLSLNQAFKKNVFTCTITIYNDSRGILTQYDMNRNTLNTMESIEMKILHFKKFTS